MSYFVITPGTDHVALDATSRTGTLVFSVQNKTGAGRQVRGVVTVDDPAQGDWYTVREPVRQVRMDETAQFQVDIAVPEDVEAGRQAFRLKVLATDDPDDVYHESQLIPVEVPPRIDKGGMPWWLWLAIAAAIVAVLGVLAFLLFRDGDPPPPPPTPGTPTATTTPTSPGTEPPTPGTEPPTPGTEPPTPGTEPPTPGLDGTWDLVRWVEAGGPVQLGFAPIDGVLVIDADRAAVWQFRIDDEFADDEGDAASRCEGAIDLAGTLTPTRGPDELSWTSNMRSLRTDIGLAFCGRALHPERGELRSPFTIAQEGDVLEMRNEQGTLSWRRR
jgi:hypothetical protein